MKNEERREKREEKRSLDVQQSSLRKVRFSSFLTLPSSLHFIALHLPLIATRRKAIAIAVWVLYTLFGWLIWQVHEACQRKLDVTICLCEAKQCHPEQSEGTLSAIRHPAGRFFAVGWRACPRPMHRTTPTLHYRIVLGGGKPPPYQLWQLKRAAFARGDRDT